MDDMRTVILPSGAELRLHAAPFKEARALYQALLEEIKTVNLDPKAEVDVNLFKDLFCAGLSSKKVEACLEKCMERAIYNKKQISADTFEPVAAREDYLMVCVEVMKENIEPFMKNLYALYDQALVHLTKKVPA